MLAKKKKFSKKEMKEDKLVTVYYETVDFVKKYHKHILSVFAGVIVAIFAVYYFIDAAATKNVKAAGELSKVLVLYNSGLYKEAIEVRAGTDITGLKAIVENYGGSENGEVARIYLANCYFYTGEFEKSIEQFEDYSGDNSLFKSASLAGIAACNADLGNYGQAADYYLKASEKDKVNPLNSEYLLNAGINYLRSGDKATAKDVLNIIKKDYAKSAENTMADRYLAECG